MPDTGRLKRYSTRLIGLAIAALLIFIAVVFILYGLDRQAEYERYADKHRQEYTSNTYTPERQRCFRLGPGLQHDCVTKARNEATAYNREQQDLVAQRVTALWTKLMGAAAIIGMVMSAFGVFLVFTTFKATREGNEIARQVGIDETQAYVHLKGIRWYESGDNFHFTFFVENSGATPCLRFVTSAIKTISQPGQAAIPHDPITVKNVGWSALPGNSVFTCDVAPQPAIPIGQIKSRTKDDLLIVAGAIKYQTFYGDWFMSEFSFMGRGRGTRSEKEPEGTRMSRTPLPVRVFERTERPE